MIKCTYIQVYNYIPINKRCIAIYMYALQHLCSQRGAGPEVQISLKDRIGHALQMIVLLCPSIKWTSPCHPNYICILHIFVHTHTRSLAIQKIMLVIKTLNIKRYVCIYIYLYFFLFIFIFYLFIFIYMYIYL